MLRWSVIGIVAAAAMLSRPAVATADPAAPQPGTPCDSSLDGAMTMPQDHDTPLVCVDTRWQSVTTPYPVSDRWLSHGTATLLRGQGRPNPTMLSGDWIATPLHPESRCRAEQVAVIPGSPTFGAPRIDDGQPGQPLTVAVAPTMSTIAISGDCLWQKAEPGPEPSGW
jgi:hypothetical protein